MQELETLQTYLLWLIIGFIVFRYFLPSLSSYLKEKLTGRDEEEKFDLNEMVHRKQEVFDRLADHSKPAFERMIQQSKDLRSQELLKEIYWGAGPQSEELLKEAQKVNSNSEINWAHLRSSYFELLKNESFNQSEELVAFECLKTILIDFAIKRTVLTTPDLKHQLIEMHKTMAKSAKSQHSI